MRTCKICDTEVNEELALCNVCNYPLKGTEKEQASYVARQIIQKSEVEEALKVLKKSRIILLVLGAFYLIIPFTPFNQDSSTFALIINFSLGLLFAFFGFMTLSAPKTALLTPLILILLYYLLLLFTDPTLLFRGLLWKVIVVIGLGYGYLGVLKSERILKENKYLASVLGFNKIRNK